MRLVLTAEALESCLYAISQSFEFNSVLSSTIAIDLEILELYEKKLGDWDLFRNWLTSAYQSNLSLITLEQNDKPPHLSLDLLNYCYVNVAFNWGLTIIISESKTECINTDSLRTKAIGVVTYDLRNFIDNPPVGSTFGTNPQAEYSLRHGDQLDLHFINPYLAGETQMLVYDKYLNQTAFQTLKMLLSLSSNLERLVVLSRRSANYCYSAQDAANQLSYFFPEIEFIGRRVTKDTSLQIHDRWIHLGKRFEIQFTRGLDSISWSNVSNSWYCKEGHIIVRNVFCSHDTRVFECTDGTIYNCPKS